LVFDVFFFNNSLTFLAILILCLNGCSTIQPWQRGNLAKEIMAPDPNPEFSSLSQHVFGSREAGAAASKGVGGGCGCY
jgi:hypothetical protein